MIVLVEVIQPGRHEAQLPQRMAPGIFEGVARLRLGDRHLVLGPRQTHQVRKGLLAERHEVARLGAVGHRGVGVEEDVAAPRRQKDRASHHELVADRPGRDRERHPDEQPAHALHGEPAPVQIEQPSGGEDRGKEERHSADQRRDAQQRAQEQPAAGPASSRIVAPGETRPQAAAQHTDEEDIAEGGAGEVDVAGKEREDRRREQPDLRAVGPQTDPVGEETRQRGQADVQEFRDEKITTEQPVGPGQQERVARQHVGRWLSRVPQEALAFEKLASQPVVEARVPRELPACGGHHPEGPCEPQPEGHGEDRGESDATATKPAPATHPRLFGVGVGSQLPIGHAPERIAAGRAPQERGDKSTSIPPY